MAHGAQVRGIAGGGAHPGAAKSEVPSGDRHAPLAPSRVVATAGHVDHGKSTLVEWLTGTNPDRLEEERRRGLTIDLGFASALLGSGIEVGFVDVPGHVRFLKNMLAGVGAVDACLFVVAATEGWKPQSEDHLRILELAGARSGVVALTHAALVDAARLDAALAELAERLDGTFLEHAPVVAVDVPAGVGTDGPTGLRAVLGALVDDVPPAADRGRPRMWIDRSFGIRGAGTVVTGTLTGGSIDVGDHLTITTGRSVEGIPVRVRGLESYGRRIERAEPGRRLAVNVAGADRQTVVRGAALVRGAQWHRCRTLDASLRVLAGVDHPVTSRGAYLAHIGTLEQAVRVRIIGGNAGIGPGETWPVRLWLSSPLPLAPGDRFILRDAGRQELVGGGEVLDVDPILPASRARPSASVARIVAERGWVEAPELERLAGLARAEPTFGRWVVDPEALEGTHKDVEQKVAAAGPSGLDVSTLDEHERALVPTMSGLTVSHGIARVAEAGAPREAAGADAALPAADADLAGHPYLRALESAPFTPPPPDGVERNDLRRLVRSGLVVETGGVWFAASAIDHASRRVATMLSRTPDGVRVSDVRDELGASRRFVLALLAHLDAIGVTRRRGDLRMAGPTLPAVDAAVPERGEV